MAESVSLMFLVFSVVVFCFVFPLPKWQSKMNNPVKLATDEEKQRKNITQ
jgi:hypothetical protein